MRKAVLLITALLSVGACSDSGTEPGDLMLYTIQVVDEQFKIRVDDAAVRAKLDARLQAGLEGVISGKLVRGSDGYNSPWNWHLDPESIEVPDLAIEVCDGRPSMIEEDLDYWMGSVKQYCPWGAKVIAVAN